MDTQLQELAADRICKDYAGSVDDFDYKVKIKSEKRIHKLEYKDDGFHFYTRQWKENKKTGKVTPTYVEVKLDDEDEEKILDEFYAWY